LACRFIGDRCGPGGNKPLIVPEIMNEPVSARRDEVLRFGAWSCAEQNFDTFVDLI